MALIGYTEHLFLQYLLSSQTLFVISYALCCIRRVVAAFSHQYLSNPSFHYTTVQHLVIIRDRAYHNVPCCFKSPPNAPKNSALYDDHCLMCLSSLAFSVLFKPSIFFKALSLCVGYVLGLSSMLRERSDLSIGYIHRFGTCPTCDVCGDYWLCSTNPLQSQKSSFFKQY